MIIIGIDPGAEGGIAMIQAGIVLSVRPLPVIGGELTSGVLSDWLPTELDTCLVYVERQQPMPKNGCIASFRLGQNYGTILGMLGTLGISTELVSPKVWKEAILPGTAKDKAAAIAYCGRAYPKTTLLRTPKCKVGHDGMADALCIATYGYRVTIPPKSPVD